MNGPSHVVYEVRPDGTGGYMSAEAAIDRGKELVGMDAKTRQIVKVTITVIGEVTAGQPTFHTSEP